MKRIDWRRAYEPLPEALDNRVFLALQRLKEEEKPMRKHTLRTAAIVLAILAALGGAAYAILENKTADYFGWFYGEDKREELLSGDLALSGQSYTLGDVTYTLDSVIYKDGTVYGTGTIAPAKGANVVLMPEDYAVDDPAGYDLFYGGDAPPADAPTYAELVKERGARLLLAHCVANGVLNDDGTLNASEIGYSNIPQNDGTILFAFEFAGGAVEGETMTEAEITRAARYRVSLHLANWEVTTEGKWLRDEPDDTSLRSDWTVTVEPTEKGE